jgi:hypothetical protein
MPPRADKGTVGSSMASPPRPTRLGERAELEGGEGDGAPAARWAAAAEAAAAAAHPPAGKPSDVRYAAASSGQNARPNAATVASLPRKAADASTRSSCSRSASTLGEEACAGARRGEEPTGCHVTTPVLPPGPSCEWRRLAPARALGRACCARAWASQVTWRSRAEEVVGAAASCPPPLPASSSPPPPALATSSRAAHTSPTSPPEGRAAVSVSTRPAGSRSSASRSAASRLAPRASSHDAHACAKAAASALVPPCSPPPPPCCCSWCLRMRRSCTTE